MKTLFHINEDLLMLQDLLEGIEDDDAQVEEILKYLEGTQQELNQKLDNYAELIQELHARAEVRKQRAKEMQALAKADETLASRLKNTLKLFFEMHGLKRQDTERHRITLAKNGGKAPLLMNEILPEDLPEQYRKIAVTADTEAIRNALEKGEDLGFARLGDRSTSIRIK